MLMNSAYETNNSTAMKLHNNLIWIWPIWGDNNSFTFSPFTGWLHRLSLNNLLGHYLVYIVHIYPSMPSYKIYVLQVNLLEKLVGIMALFPYLSPFIFPFPSSSDTYSVYFLFLPYALCTGYFSRFCWNFCSTAAGRSIRHLSANLTR